MSTKEVLSEGELDALMDSVSTGDAPLEQTAEGQACQPFDFNTREQALLAQMPALKTINEKHSLSLVQGIQDIFKVPVAVEVGETRLVKLDEAIVSISEPSGINLTKVKPLNGVSFVVFPGEFLSFFVDQYFGGSPSSSDFKSSRVDLTPTERRINDLLTEKFLTTLELAWSEKVELKAETVSFETNPDFLQVASPEELALQFSFVVKVFEWEGVVHWIVPYSAIEPIKPRLGSPASRVKPEKGGNWEGYFRQELLSVDLDVSGLFTSRSVSLAEVLGLREGAIVPLHIPTEVTVCIEGHPFCVGEHGALNGKKSIKIKEILKDKTSSL